MQTFSAFATTSPGHELVGTPTAFSATMRLLGSGDKGPPVPRASEQSQVGHPAQWVRCADRVSSVASAPHCSAPCCSVRSPRPQWSHPGAGPVPFRAAARSDADTSPHADEPAVELPGGGRCCSRAAGWSRSTATRARPRSACSASREWSRGRPGPPGRRVRTGALSTVPVVPSFEIIATVAQRAPGRDGDYSGESSVRCLRPWVDAAGRSRHVGAARPAARPGRLPRPGQALRVAAQPAARRPGRRPGVEARSRQKPLGQIGSIDAAEINRARPGWPTWSAPTTCRRSCSWSTSSGCR